MFSLAGRTALITGAGRGIGQAIALRLAAAGAKVWVHYNTSRQPAEALVEMIRSLDGTADAVGGDVSDSAQVEAMFAAIEAAGPAVDILVNNAGINIEQHLVRMSDAEIMQVVSTNYLGVIYCTRRALGPMRKNRWGRLIHISSVVGRLGSPMQTIYCSTKSALLGFSKALMKEYGNRGITSNVILPGLIESDMTSKLPEELLKGMLERIPAGRAGLPEEVAAAVHFLATEEAGYLNGAELDVNGGML